LSRRVEDQEDLIKGLQAGLVGMKDRVGVLEMSLSMICSRVQVLEDAMEIDPPVMDLSGGDSTNSEYADVDDGGAMLVSQIVPPSHVLGLLLFSFCNKFTHTQSHSARKPQKHHITQ
jgi:hypothetical protein